VTTFTTTVNASISYRVNYYYYSASNQWRMRLVIGDRFLSAFKGSASVSLVVNGTSFTVTGDLTMVIGRGINITSCEYYFNIYEFSFTFDNVCQNIFPLLQRWTHPQIFILDFCILLPKLRKLFLFWIQYYE